MPPTTITARLLRLPAIAMAWLALFSAVSHAQYPAVDAQFAPQFPPSPAPGGMIVTDVPLNMLPTPGVPVMPPPLAEAPPQALPPAVEFTPGPLMAPPNAVPIEEPPPRGVRSGMFQRVVAAGTWISPGGQDGLGMSDIELKGIFALPLPVRSWPLVITPGFAVHWLDAPGTDLPPRLYDAYTDFRWLPKLGPRLMLDLAVTPGVYRDFDAHTEDGVRITSHAAAVWTCTPTAKVVLGASYLDRSDLNVIPICGLLWTPTPDWQMDLLFPQPKIARRIYCFGQCGTEVEDWAYVAGEFGDWAWAIRHSDGSLDTAEYRDARLLLGIERKVFGGLSGRMEVGYVFARKVRYTSGRPDFEPNSAVLVRAGVDY
jgi:hypothetical protein